MEKVIINGTTYVPETEAKAKAMAVTDGMEYVIVRTYSAGVHMGYLKSREIGGKEVTLVNARRAWYWAGAFTLSAMAMNGVSKPSECKFSTTVPEIILTEAIEIIPCTEKAKEILEGVSDHDPE